MDHSDSGSAGGQAQEAVARLYELTREGDTTSGEYRQLDSLVYDSLLRAYGVQPEAEPEADAEPERSVQYA